MDETNKYSTKQPRAKARMLISAGDTIASCHPYDRVSSRNAQEQQQKHKGNAAAARNKQAVQQQKHQQHDNN